MVKISRVTVNYQENPVGIEKLEQIGWKFTDEKRNVVQKAYELQIAGDLAFEELLYDSGRVASAESVHVTVPKEALSLQSTTKYFFRVRIETNDGDVSDWKEGFFVTALLQKEEWLADFITIETEDDSKDSRGSYIRKKITVSGKPVSAYLYTTALGLYQVYLNGGKISADEFTPGWTSYNKHLLYQMYDVTELLKQEDNVLGAMVGAGWYKGTMGFVRMRNHYGKRAAFAAQLKISYEDGSTETISTDDTWQGAWSPVLFSEMYDGELYDANQEIENWADCDCSYTDWKKVFVQPFDIQVMRPQSGAKARQMESLPVKQIIVTPKGDTVLDFGQNMTGWISFAVQGKKGDRAEINCFEVLDAEGNVYLDNLRSAKETITYICKDEDIAEFHPHFSFQGFQYAKIAAYPGEIKAENFTAHVIHSDMKPAGSFECSNPDINQLMHNVLWGMKGNFLDVPTDCPQRDERLGWTGDAQIFCRTASYLMDTYTFYRKWLRDVAADQTAEGGVPHVVPDLLIGKSASDRLMKDGEHSAAAWADAAVIIPWTLYLHYGDKAVLEEQYDSMKAWIEFMRKHSNNHIWNYKLQFGDWVALDAEEGSYFGATPNDLTCTAYYAYSTGLFAKIAGVLGRTEDAAEYKELYDQIVDSYEKTFFAEDGHLNVQTQTAQIVTLYFNLVKEENRQNVVEDLLKLLEKENGHLVTGFVGTPYFCHALSQNGHTKEAYELLLKDDFPSWLYQVKQGATTIWEHWDGLKPDGTMWSPDMNSFNHYAYGAIGEWIYRAAAGIECDEKTPGFQKVVIAPHIGGGLSWLQASYDSVYGTISVGWEVKDTVVTVKIEIPCNATASICLQETAKVLKTDGLSFKKKGLEFAAEAGSGSYCIQYEMEK